MRYWAASPVIRCATDAYWQVGIYGFRDISLPTNCLLPPPDHRVKFFVTTQRRRAGLMRCVKSALDLAQSKYLPHMQRFSKPLERTSSEIPVFEKAAHKAMSNVCWSCDN